MVKLQYFLGIEVARSKEGINLSQRKYTLDILEETGLLGAKPIETPLDPNVKLYVDREEAFSHLDQYRRFVGKYRCYLTNTRLDILFVISVVSQFMSAPRVPHWEACLHIVKYLKAHPGRDLFYRSNGHLRIETFTDVD